MDLYTTVNNISSLLTKDKETQKLKWLEKCIEQLNDNKWVITSLKHIREILQQYQEVRLFIEINCKWSRVYTIDGLSSNINHRLKRLK